VGRFVRRFVGWFVGRSVGRSVRRLVGDNVGLAVGNGLGNVGFLVISAGFFVGLLDGVMLKLSSSSLLQNFTSFSSPIDVIASISLMLCNFSSKSSSKWILSSSLQLPLKMRRDKVKIFSMLTIFLTL